MPRHASDIAKYLLALSEPEKGDILSNLKLQKLLYYAQGFHLAMFGEQLFIEDVYAWQYGPVVPEVYHEYKELGSAGIPVPEKFQIELPDEVREMIHEVYAVYGQFSAIKLMDMTHEESPWKETPMNSVIDPALMKNYFIPLVAA